MTFCTYPFQTPFTCSRSRQTPPLPDGSFRRLRGAEPTKPSHAVRWAGLNPRTRTGWRRGGAANARPSSAHHAAGGMYIPIGSLSTKAWPLLPCACFQLATARVSDQKNNNQTSHPTQQHFPQSVASGSGLSQGWTRER